MAYYPLFLEMTGRPCLVVGGGEVARRKAEALLAAGAAVTVVSPKLTPQLAALKGRRLIRHIERPYRRGDLDGKALVVAATDDRDANSAVASDARVKGVLVNAVDDPAACDFILPAVVRQGEVMLAISTGGLSPALARWLRQELEGYLSGEFAPLAELLADVRVELKAQGVTVEADAWQQAIDDDLRALLAEGRRDEAKARVLSALGSPTAFKA